MFGGDETRPGPPLMVSGSKEGGRRGHSQRERAKGHTRPLLNLRDQETEREREEDKVSLNVKF